MPATLHDVLATAVTLHRANRLAEAERVYRRVLAISPEQPDALRLLGLLTLGRGDSRQAIRLIARAVALDLREAGTRRALAEALEAAGMAEAAQRQRRAAAALHPGEAASHAALGHAAGRQGRNGAAALAFRRAALVGPERIDDALNQAVCLKRVGGLDGAEAACRRALEIDPAHPGALTLLGQAHGGRGQVDGAVTALRRALSLVPEDRSVRKTLCDWLLNADRTAEAEPLLRRLAAEAPRDLELRLNLCRLHLPLCFDDAGAIAGARGRYRAEVERLATDMAAEPSAFDPPGDTTIQTLPYYLPYQGGNDRDLQALYGAVLHRAMAMRRPDLAAPPPPPPPPAAGERIRVGIASAFFCLHSNWKIPIRGWVEGLDRRRFELIGYALGARKDEATALARTLFDRFEEGPRPFDAWADAIRGDRLHALIYPEIGMDPLTAQLAALPLAARQATSWGHPNTSGLPTIGHFLSSDLMEPEDAEDHYTERLVRLPNLSIHYHADYTPAVAAAPPDFAAHGLRPDATVYLCCQYLPKYLPQHDAVLARIARRTPDAQFVFLGGLPEATNARVLRRLRAAFAAAGADPEAVVMLPTLGTGGYAALQRRGDVFLDSIGWSGCNSTLEALVHALPVVTLPGRFMRERHSFAILAMMGVHETVARDIDDYVEIAVRLGVDPDWRRLQSDRIRAERGRVYGDRACVAALESFLERCAAGDPP